MPKPDRVSTKISLVVADVDGTLVTADKVLTPRAAAAVTALGAAGIAFAITSGRPPRGMAMLIDPLALRTPVAGFNGGIFVKPDMTVIEEHVLPADIARRAVEINRGSAQRLLELVDAQCASVLTSASQAPPESAPATTSEASPAPQAPLPP